MRKAFVGLLAALSVLVSCDKNDFYIQLPGTVWMITTDSQTAIVCFHDGEHASVLQHAYETNYRQTLHGTYDCDGHAVVVTPTNSSTNKLVRTFSHLKSASTNKNLTKMFPAEYNSLSGSIWSTIEDNNLHIAYFRKDGSCVNITYDNITREEGTPYGWSAGKSAFTLSGSSIQTGGVSATLFDGFMVVDTLGVMCNSPVLEEEGTSALEGTIWTYNNSGYPAATPGIVIFNGKDTFTRIMGLSSVVFGTAIGTYTVSGSTVTMTLDDKSESCLISGDSFTFFERDYTRKDY